MAYLPRAGTTRVSQVPDASLHAYHALRGPRQILGDLTNAIPLCRLLMRENHRHLPACLYGAVSSFRECGLPCGLRGALCTLHPCRSVCTSFTSATRGRSGWLDLTPQGLAPCKKRQASLGALTLALTCCRKRKRRRRLGRPRARSLTRLFPRPPTEPCGTVSVLHGSPVGTIHRFRITGITPPSPAIVLHLWSFALWLAFPTSDYYGHSVTLGLSPRRPSRSSCTQHVRA